MKQTMSVSDFKNYKVTQLLPILNYTQYIFFYVIYTIPQTTLYLALLIYISVSV
jgi:hypothetical protein